MMTGVLAWTCATESTATADSVTLRPSIRSQTLGSIHASSSSSSHTHTQHINVYSDDPVLTSARRSLQTYIRLPYPYIRRYTRIFDDQVLTSARRSLRPTPQPPYTPHPVPNQRPRPDLAVLSNRCCTRRFTCTWYISTTQVLPATAPHVAVFDIAVDAPVSLVASV